MDDKEYLLKAIEKAKESISKGGFPAGAVIVKEGRVVGEGISVGNKLFDTTTNPEMEYIRNACKEYKTTNLTGCTLYASMEPCVMCLGASMWSSISRIVYALSKSKVSTEYYGGSYDQVEINSKFNHPIEIVHLSELEEDSLKVVREWEKSL
jgi:tRNA(Arg) A34 adenosine deaminase TadA